MRYSLWSRGTLIGYTELDLPHVSPDMLMGFVEPTDAGRQALIDATGVHAVCATRPARWRDRDEVSEQYMKAFRRASDRREALDLELHDDRGELFPCAFMRIYDLRLQWPEPELDDDDLDPELRAQTEHDAEMIREWIEEAEEEREADAWKYTDEPEDPRWETMQYHIQVYLHEPTLEEIVRELEADDHEPDDREPWSP